MIPQPRQLHTEGGTRGRPIGEVYRGLAVVLVNWERAALTIQALESLLNSVPPPEWAVVVDNASGDDSVASFRDWAVRQGIPVAVHDPGASAYDAPAPWLTILRAPSNRGFGSGNNIGLRFLLERTEASHFFLLNNDARVQSDCLRELARALGQVPHAGVVTGTIYVDRPGIDQIWYAGGDEIQLRGVTRHRTTPPADYRVQPTDFVSGCAMVISRAAIERVGLFDPCFNPGYWEDADYSRRARAAGLRVIYAPAMTIYHKVGATTGEAKASSAVSYTQSRNRMFYIRRNYSGAEKAAAIAYNVITKPGRAIVEALLGRPRIGWAVLRGTVAGLLLPCGKRGPLK